MIMMLVLIGLYGLVTLADCLIAIFAVRRGAAEELNPIIKGLLKSPILFFGFEIAIFVLLVWATLVLRDWYRWVGYGLVIVGIVWKGWLVSNDIRIIRRSI